MKGNESRYCKRSTSETVVEVLLSRLPGEVQVETGIGFFDHMLKTFFKYSQLSGLVLANGDLVVDDHHTIEDVGLALGKVVSLLVEDVAIQRYAQVLMPMDEALVRVVLDLGGRPYLDFEHAFRAPSLGGYSTQMTEEFLRAFAMQSMGTLHVDVLKGKNDHHVTEAIYKGLGMAVAQAMSVLGTGVLCSTKGKVVSVYDRCAQL